MVVSTMKRKSKFTIFSVLILLFLLFKSIIRIIFPHIVYPADIEEIIPLAIGLILIIMIAIYFKQKNWRIGWAMVGISSIIISGVMLNLKLIRLLHSINTMVLLFGLVNFYLFHKSDFEPSPVKDKLRFMSVFLCLFVVITIFVAIFFISNGL